MLGKTVLAGLHPSLIADPQSSVSLFAAAGLNVGTDLKTIAAKTLFERLGHVSKRFDKKTQDHCVTMSARRNAELHSGEAPFEGMILNSWEGRYWHTAEIILEIKGSSLEEWLGTNQAKAPQELLADYLHALKEATKIRIETAQEYFEKLDKKKRDALHASAERMIGWENYRVFKIMADDIWDYKCPACGSKAFVAGVKFSEEPVEDEDHDALEETIAVSYVADEFRCPSCALNLESRDAIEAAGLDVDKVDFVEREREYGPDYGND